MSVSDIHRNKAKRPYAARLPEPYCRREMLCLRVSPMSRTAVQRLALERAMSPSEYLAHLVNEHLNAIARTRGLHVLLGN